ncbi:nwd2 [Moniliophthora roreri MCA 2997]|uniref:Nwd2 n=1 Tax=Moniliophthora roreri (strain MCA 2997) TaxID=1381753 RepID=V2WYT5_MONRO|nr:nwd2 [Moniliophthora roreri MCA 2997]
MFSRTRVGEISGGTFNNVARDQINTTVNYSNDGIQMLWNAITDVGATHDAEARYPPPKCHPQTRVALLDTLLDWIRDNEGSAPSVYWLNGPAGSGKSAIAQTIAEVGEREGFLASSFFFSREHPKRNHPSFLFLTMAYEMASQVDELRLHIQHTLRRKPGLLQATVDRQFKELILTPLCALSNHEWSHRPPIVIIDGLDECEDSDAQRRVLRLIIVGLKRHVPLRFLICSRSEVSIRETLGSDTFRPYIRCITLDDSWTTKSDIEMVLRDGFARIRESRKYDNIQFPDPWPSDTVIRELTKKACGQFLYVTTVLEFIDDEYSQPWKRLDVILDASHSTEDDAPFRDLDELYRQILSCNPDRSKVVDILGTILHLQHTRILDNLNRPVSPSLVEDVLGLPVGDVSLALRGMHSVLDIGSTEKGIVVLHASFIDFLLNQSRSGPFFVDQDQYGEMFFPNHIRAQILQDDFLLGPDWQAGWTATLCSTSPDDQIISALENVDLHVLFDVTLKASIISDNQTTLSEPLHVFDSVAKWLEEHSSSVAPNVITQWRGYGAILEVQLSKVEDFPVALFDDLSTIMAFQIAQTLEFPDEGLPQPLVDSMYQSWENIQLHRTLILSDMRVVGVGRRCSCSSFYPKSIYFLCKNGVHHLQLYAATMAIIEQYIQMMDFEEDGLSFVLVGFFKYWGPQDELLLHFLTIADYIHGANDVKRVIAWLNSFPHQCPPKSLNASVHSRRLHACYVRVATNVMESMNTDPPNDFGIALWYPLLCYGEPSLLARCGPEVKLLPLFRRILNRTDSSYGLPEQTIIKARQWLELFPRKNPEKVNLMKMLDEMQ